MNKSNKVYVADGTENIIRQNIESGYKHSQSSRNFHHVNADQNPPNRVASIFKKQDENISSSGGDDDLMSQAQEPQKPQKDKTDQQKKDKETQGQPKPAPGKFAPGT